MVVDILLAKLYLLWVEGGGLNQREQEEEREWELELECKMKK